MKANNGHIVIVEDEALLRLSLRHFFDKHNFKVADFHNTSEALKYIKQHQHSDIPVDIIFCDIMLPNGCGYELMEALKSFNNLGKIFISAKSQVQERIKGLSYGVDDYLCKPVDSTELLLRTQTLLKRLKPLSPNDEKITFLNFSLHPEARILESYGGDVELGQTEFQVLLSLIARQGKICTRQQLCENLSDSEAYLKGRALDVLIGRLRKKLASITQEAEYIVTMRSQGYLLCTSPIQ